MTKDKSFNKNLWGKPIVMGILILAGLILALVGKGFWDVVACVLLIIPIVVVIRKLYFNQKVIKK